MSLKEQLKSSSLLLIITSSLIAGVAAVMLALGYYLIWDMSTDIPIPEIYSLKYVGYQCLFFTIVNGIIHYKFIDKRYNNSFQYIKWILVLLIANITFCYVSMSIRMLPSINEIKRLYGDAGMPNLIYSLSVPISLIGSLVTMLGIPYFLNRNGAPKADKDRIKEYHTIAYKLFQSYLIVVAIILVVNVSYYQLYLKTGGVMPSNGYSLGVLIQMTFALTAVAAMLFLYLRDHSENGLSIYVIFTAIVAISAFMAGLPRVDGQPVLDDTIWLNLPITLVSLAGELIGIPYFFKNLMKPKPESQYRR